MKDNLIPTVIVDKNNKTTTVYKKAADDSAAAVLPGPDGKLVQEAPTATSFLHSLFPSMKRKAAEREERKRHEALVKKLNKHEKYTYTAETLKDAPIDRLQKLAEIYDALPEGATKKVREGGRETLFAPELQRMRPLAIDVAHANREFLKHEIPVNFMIDMFRPNEVDSYTVENLKEHWGMQTGLASLRAGADYRVMRSLQEAVKAAPEQFESLLHLATVAVGKLDSSDLKNTDVPQRFLSFINEWPDNEDRIIEHYREYGAERFTHDTLSGVLRLHPAVDDGFL